MFRGIIHEAYFLTANAIVLFSFQTLNPILFKVHKIPHPTPLTMPIDPNEALSHSFASWMLVHIFKFSTPLLSSRSLSLEESSFKDSIRVSVASSTRGANDWKEQGRKITVCTSLIRHYECLRSIMQRFDVTIFTR